MKKNVILAILSVLLVILAGYICYDKLLSQKTSASVEETNKLAKEFYENMKNNRTVLADYDNGLNIVVDKNGDVYYSAQSISKSIGTKGQYTIENYMSGIDKDGKMINVLDGYKLDISNVVLMYHVITGNGGLQYYIFIKDDGTIGRLTYNVSFDSKVSINNFESTVSGYKNIVSVVASNSWDAHGYKLVDIYGNTYNV